MASPTYLSDCGDATGDLSEFAGVSGTVSVSTNRPVTGTRSLEMDSGGGSAAYVITSADPAGAFPLQGAGNAGSRRGSSYHEFDAYPATSAAIIRDHSGAFFEIRLTSTGTLQLVTNQTASPVTLKTSVATVSLNTQTRVSWAYTTTTTSNFTIKVWIGGSLVITATQADGTLGDVGGYNLDYGWFTNPGASKKTWVDNIWVENDATLTDPGDVKCATARPNAAGSANAFDTPVGGLTNRWDYVTSLPVDTSAYLQHAGIAQAAENFGLDTSGIPGGAAILGWRGWAYVKKGSAVAAPTVVSGFINNSTAAGATLAVTVSGIQNGDSLIVLAANGIAGTTGWSCSDNGTNGASGNWTADLAPTKATGTLTTAVYSRHNIQDASKPTTVTVTFNATGERAVKVLLVRGLATSSARDVATSTNNFTTSATTTTAASGTLSQASELVLGLYSWLGTSAADTFTANGSWTAAPGGNAGTTSSGVDTVVNAVYQVTSAVTSVQPSANITSGAAGLGVTVSYKGLEASTDVSRLTVDGADYSVGAFPASPAQVWKHVAASALPSSSAAVGIKSTSTNEDTYLYDCGVVVAYIPGGEVSGAPMMMAGN